MKLNLVTPRTGAQWVREGVRVFFKQPLALGGLFFLFMGILSVVTMVPVIGGALALIVLPAATLGLMQAAALALAGTFPMPKVLFSAFMHGKAKSQAMLHLGALYAVAFLLLIGATVVMDGGSFAKVYLFGEPITQEIIDSDGFYQAMWVGTLLYFPLGAMFWHAPALVFWHDVPPAKSMFFSLAACWKNKGAMLIYMASWFVLFSMVSLVVVTVVSGLGGPGIIAALVAPLGMLLAAMFFASIYLTYRDSFVIEHRVDTQA